MSSMNRNRTTPRPNLLRTGCVLTANRSSTPNRKSGFDLLKYGGAKGIRTPHLLDANESVLAFVAASCAGCARKPLVRALDVLVAESCR